MKKIILGMAAFGLMMLVACGDDSSSNANSSVKKDEKGRVVYTDMREALNAPCSAENKCEVIVMNDPVAQDVMQCNGTSFISLLGKDALPDCAETPATSATEPAQTPSDNNGAPAGNLISCELTIEGVFGEHSCVEGAAADKLSQYCESMLSFASSMHMTIVPGTGCSTSVATLKCQKNGMNFYSFDESQTSCENFLDETLLAVFNE